MPKSPAWAKNVVKQVLWTAIDRELTPREVDALWANFGSACAYCGASLRRGDKSAHKDHLLPVELGGTNHISNRVLSCAACNEKEKRDEPWLDFLTRKVPDRALFDARKTKIEVWRQQHADSFVPVSAGVREIWIQEKDRLACEIELSLTRVRAAKRGP